MTLFKSFIKSGQSYEGSGAYTRHSGHKVIEKTREHRGNLQDLGQDKRNSTLIESSDSNLGRSHHDAAPCLHAVSVIFVIFC